MTDGGNNLNNNGMNPPPPPPPPAPGGIPGSGEVKPAWYENVAIVILALFCCSPLGLVLVWINKTWTTKTKTIITAVIVGLAVVFAVIGAASGGSSDSNASAPATSAATQSTNGGSQTTAAPASAKTCKETPNTESFDSKKQGLYPSRAGVTKTDHEAALGDCVRVSGATIYVTAADVTTDSITNKQGIIVSVSETNRDKATKSYNALDWKIQTPQGTIENITVIFGDNSKSLSAGELVTGGTAEGTVAFDYAGPGTYYVLYKPVLSLGSDVGVWGITVP